MPGGADDTDVGSAQVKSVYEASDLSDYAGALEARLTIRLTDKQAGVASTGMVSAEDKCAPRGVSADSAPSKPLANQGAHARHLRACGILRGRCRRRMWT
jgi:hypothetical protein